MNITYLDNVKKYLQKNDPTLLNKITESEINSLESKHGVTFPVAYKELLYLTGEDFEPFGFNFGVDWSEKNIWPNEKEWLKDAGVELPKPYWVFGEDNAVVSFFYLDEGDDPPVYQCELDYYGEDPNYYLRKTDDTFSGFIENEIKYYEEFGRQHYYSEIKVLAQVDEDIAKIADDRNIDYNLLTIKTKIYSTFEPCNVCKRDIIIRKQLCKNMDITVFRPFYWNVDGFKEVVTTSWQFEDFIKQNMKK